MAPVLWLFGLPSSGKTTISHALRDHLLNHGRQVVLLDGDELRSTLSADLGFSDVDRCENLRRAANIAQLLSSQGHLVVCSFVTPKEHHRALVRQILGEAVVLVHVHCPLEVCISRDVKGLYAKAAAKKMTGMTGVQDDFDFPADRDMEIPTHELTVPAAVARVSALVAGKNAAAIAQRDAKALSEGRPSDRVEIHEHRATATTQDNGGRRRRSAGSREDQAA